MDLFTVEEHDLAKEIKEKASTLVSLTLVNNDVGLYNMLDDLITISAPRTNSKKKDLKKDSRIHYESYVYEAVGPNRGYVIKIASVLSNNTRICLKIAQALLQIKTYGGNSVEYFKNIVSQLKKKLGIKESLDDTREFLQEIDGDKKLATQAPEVSQNKEEADILYHLDVATRHIDVLVEFSLIHGHESEIVGLSSQIQELAQRLRAELEARRVPLTKQKK